MALAGNGATVLVGGSGNASNAGAAWVFVPLSVLDKVSTHDFNGDVRSDILWRDTSGNVAIWEMTGTTVLNAKGLGNITALWTIAGQRDFNGDSFTDILWRDTIGDVAIWEMDGTEVHLPLWIGNMSTDWSIVLAPATSTVTALVTFSGITPAGTSRIWLMNSSQILNASNAFVGNVPTTWAIVGTGDFDGDGMDDILWRDTGGNTAIWFMKSGTQVLSTAGDRQRTNCTWSVVARGISTMTASKDIFCGETPAAIHRSGL